MFSKYSKTKQNKTEEKGKLTNTFYKSRFTLIPKPDKGTTKKEKLQVNIPNENICKNPQQNISKPHTTTH